MLDIMIVYSRT